jgi:hypothetical protein
MANNYLDFISDENFKTCVYHVLKGYAVETKDQEIIDMLLEYGNTIDEFKLIFDIYGNKTNLNKWKGIEILRQTDKTINNYIGEFHQKLLGYINGWVDLGIGDETEVDLKNEDNTIFIELKNKFNTTNASSLQNVRDKLENIVSIYPNSKAYWAFVISKKHRSVNEVWKYKSKEDDRIWRISGDKLYEMITGDPKAFEKTFKALNNVLNEITEDYSLSHEDEEIINEFSKNIFKK